MTVGIKEVLLVDDEENFLEVIADVLSIYKDYFNVRTAVNGKQAVELLKSSHIDFVVTDLGMPEMDGFELLAFMNRNYPKIPVIFMTAYGTSKIEEIVYNTGALRYMEKPIDYSLSRLIPGRAYRPAAMAVFIGELMATIEKGLAIKSVGTDLRQVKEKISSGKIIIGAKVSPVIQYSELLAFRDIKKGAEQGVVDSQFYIGYSYFAGELVIKNDHEAIKWIRKAAFQGHTKAKLYLGHMYFWGDGVERDKEKGFKLIIESAEQGDDSAQFYLARMYRDGDGIDENKSEALKWFKKAAEQGHKGAMANIESLQK